MYRALQLLLRREKLQGAQGFTGGDTRDTGFVRGANRVLASLRHCAEARQRCKSFPGQQDVAVVRRGKMANVVSFEDGETVLLDEGDQSSSEDGDVIEHTAARSRYMEQTQPRHAPTAPADLGYHAPTTILGLEPAAPTQAMPGVQMTSGTANDSDHRQCCSIM